ncbi:MAG TPA: TonB family protein [Pyrinomonadaceae bacterium]|nr:TonB family protein [Pyrinomonadaceae bacterium]
MIRAALAVFTCLLLFITPGARAHLEAQQDASAAKPPRSLTAEQAAELNEAHQLNLKAVKLYQAGSYDEALALGKRALAIRERVVGREDDLVLQSLINLAEIYLARKSYSDSLSLYERVLKTNEKTVGRDDASNGPLLNVIAYLHYMMGQSFNAENYYKRALEVSEKSTDPDSEQLATAAYNLAEFYRFTRNFKKAEALYERALEIRDKKLGREDPRLLRTVDRFRCLYYQSEQEKKLKAFDEMRSELCKTDCVSADVVNGRAVSLPKPPYPQEAKSIRATGIVVVKVKIDESGKVASAEDMCGGNPWLVKAATDAAREALFTPTLLSGTPVKVTGVITYKFEL